MDAQTKDRYELRANILKALAHLTRLFLLDELSRQERCVFKLAEMIAVDVSTMSRHLKVLKNAGIVKYEKRGTLVYYHLNVPCVKFLECLETIVRTTITKKIALMG